MTLPLFLIAAGIAIFFYLLGFSAGQKSKNDTPMERHACHLEK